MVVKNADEAEIAVERWLVERFDAPEGNITVSRVDFDGNLYEVSGNYTKEGNRIDFRVKVDRDGNIVGWVMTP